MSGILRTACLEFAYLHRCIRCVRCFWIGTVTQSSATQGSNLAGVEKGGAAQLPVVATFGDVRQSCDTVMQQPAYPQQSGEDTEVCSETLQVCKQSVLSAVHGIGTALYCKAQVIQV